MQSVSGSACSWCISQVKSDWKGLQSASLSETFNLNTLVWFALSSKMTL